MQQLDVEDAALLFWTVSQSAVREAAEGGLGGQGRGLGGDQHKYCAQSVEMLPFLQARTSGKHSQMEEEEEEEVNHKAKGNLFLTGTP